MSTLKRALLFFVLPVLAVLSYPPETIFSTSALIFIVVSFFVVMAVLLWRGRNLALTFAIFLQGMNAIVRLMLFFAKAIPSSQIIDWPFAISCLLGLVISVYLLLRLDQADVRKTMIN